MPDIFLSYNREDQAKAKLIATALASEGFDVWWDTVLRAGQTYDEVTERQLHESRAVVVLWSSRSVKSKWVRAEATLGDRKSALIPVMIEPCDRPIMFELIQTADLIGWEGDTGNSNWKSFIADVREHVQRTSLQAKSASAPDPTPASPERTEKSAPAETIEAAFWMSIQDGDDPEEFESYLERYPDGHFAALARKRVAGLTAAKVAAATAAAAPAAPEPMRAAAAVQPAPRPQIPPTAPRSDPFQRNAAPQARKSGSPLPLVIGAVVAVAVIGAAVAVVPGMMNSGAPPEPVQQASTPFEPALAPVAAPEPAIPAETASVSVEEVVEPPPPIVSKVFRDCDECPEMMRLEAGAFTMGSAASEAGHRAWEGPQRQVTIAPMAVSMREVSLSEWDACVAAGGCSNYTPTDKGWGRGARPAIMVSWNDAQAYAKWLSGKTGKAYRLPTEAEWEYAARGGTLTAYWWGDRFEASRVPRGKTEETGFGDANGFGLFNVSGNVAEWVQDCYVNTFANAPVDGSAVSTSNCQRVIRGGSWKSDAADLRLANRSRLSATTRDSAIGFRVVLAE